MAEEAKSSGNYFRGKRIATGVALAAVVGAGLLKDRPNADQAKKHAVLEYVAEAKRIEAALNSVQTGRKVSNVVLDTNEQIVYNNYPISVINGPDLRLPYEIKLDRNHDASISIAKGLAKLNIFRPGEHKTQSQTEEAGELKVQASNPHSAKQNFKLNFYPDYYYDPQKGLAMNSTSASNDVTISNGPNGPSVTNGPDRVPDEPLVTNGPS